MTHNAIERALYSKPCPALRKQIKSLRSAGLLDRILTRLEPAEISWGLTPLGAEFAKRADSLVGWLDAHREHIFEAREYHKQTAAERSAEIAA
jgi:DNA-binding HxlR family transcriptional regulator